MEGTAPAPAPAPTPTLKEYLAQRGHVKGSLTKLCKSVRDLTLEGSSMEAIAVKQERLQALFAKYESLSYRIIGMDPGDKELFHEVEEKYEIALTSLKTKYNILSFSKLPPIPSQSSPSLELQKQRSNIKLPEIHIPVFEGKYSEFKGFIGLFESLIGKGSLDKVQKFYYLLSFLKGEPRDLVANLPYVDESYDRAIKILRERYDNLHQITNEHITKLLDLQPIVRSTSMSLRSFLCIVKQNIAALDSLGYNTKQWDVILHCILVKKLDNYSSREYYQERQSGEATVNELLTFLEKRALALENADGAGTSSQRTGPQRERAPTTNVAATNNSDDLQSVKSTTPACLYCKCAHRIFLCPQFQLLNVKERINFVQINNLCNICLNNHNKRCRFHFRCNVCKAKHNTLLHEDIPPISMMSNNHTSQVLLPTVKVKLFSSSGEVVYVKALMDSASQLSFVTSELVKTLNLQPSNIATGVVGIGKIHRQIKQCIDIEIHSTLSPFKVKMNCSVIDSITSMLPQSRIDIGAMKLPPYIQLADPDFGEPSQIHLLIGAGVFFQVLLPQPEQSQTSQQPESLAVSKAPYFLNTRFGYVAGGNLANQGHSEQASISLFCRECDSSINDNLTNFWKTESVPEVFPDKLPEHELSEQFFQKSVTLKDNKFQVGLPLKLPLENINSALGNSFQLALKRFYNLEKRLQKDKNLFEQYKQFIHDYVAQGHGSYIDLSLYDLTNDPVYFIAHHPVIKEESKTTKCRVVFDGSMLTDKKVALNDLLLNGPIKQRELFDILLLFRLNKFVFTCDIKAMFRNIELGPEFKSLQIILWRDTPEENIQCIRLNTVTYGLKSSSFLATRCLYELAIRYKNEFPLASSILENQTYVDDALVSSDSLPELIEMKNQLCNILKLGGFRLHKWTSNHEDVLQDVPKEHLHFDDVDFERENFCLKTLGVVFNVKTDKLKISSPLLNERVPNTKREVLSFVSRFYDPLGLVGPIIVTAKSLMQKLWSEKIDWDSHLPESLQKVWEEFYNSLSIMKPIHVDRNVTMGNATLIQLIGFADACSSTGYGCCIYLRTIDVSGNVKLSLLCSKSKINPLSQSLSVPRLELNAALLLAKLSHRVHNVLSLKLKIDEVMLFSDSQIVLAWISTPVIKLKTYIANRVEMILKYTEHNSWSYVGSENNAADCLSRGVMPDELESHDLWWHGPAFLQNREYKLSNKVELPDEIPELKQTDNDPLANSRAMVCSLSNEGPLCLDFLDYYSDLNKKQRILAYVLRFCRNLRSANKLKSDYISSKEYNDALLLIVKCEQQKYFADEFKALKGQNNVTGSLKPLHPFVDNQGILRVGGRLEYASIPYSQKHPILLPPTKLSHVTAKIIEHEHLKNLHAGQRLTLSSLNQRFWIISGLNEVKKIIHKCIICFKLKAEAAKQLMGSLPPDRVNICRAFQKIGIDFAGPISVKQSRIRRALVSKGYICVFVCFSTKAIHLELVSDLTTEAFLACFKRFIARRGMPSQVYSDNCSTFKSAKTQLVELYKLHNSGEHRERVQAFATQRAIDFHFIPCYSPVFGGLWEAAVKSSKHLLKRVVGKALLTYEELATVLCQVESVLNSRPLIPISADAEDFSYLTPGHFLIGTALNAYPEPNLTDVPIARLRFWKVCCNMYQHFWKVWSKAYLNTLQSRPKWRDDMPNVKEGALVILREQTVPMYWPMARITKVFMGSQNKVRAVEVVTPNGRKHTRSITKISVLPIE